MTAFYNEIDPYAANWLRNLITAGHIADGVVDERSIEDISPDELRQYTQCHFFAGIGVWSYALRSAGWPDTRPVWTGSCPCQPFSAAGKGAGFADERHLWPAFHYLIEKCRPPVVFGEQVASKDGLEWLDLVQTDLEGSGYATGAVDLCAAGIGAPHIRQRLYWVADAADQRRECKPDVRRASVLGALAGPAKQWDEFGDCGASVDWVADSLYGNGHQRSELESHGWQNDAKQNGMGSEPSGLADTERAERQDGLPRVGFADAQGRWHQDPTEAARLCGHLRSGPTNGHWRNADWLSCRDGKWRPVEPGTFPLAYGITNRVGRLRAYGNAIVPQVAQAFIEAYLES